MPVFVHDLNLFAVGDYLFDKPGASWEKNPDRPVRNDFVYRPFTYCVYFGYCG